MTTTSPDPVLAALRAGVVPATGCTEPVAVALAAAIAARELGAPVERLDVAVSPNIMKNGMAVVVPGTGRPGLAIAAAAGAVGGNPDGGLTVLSGLPAGAAATAGALVDAGAVQVGLAPGSDGLFVEVTASSSSPAHRATVRIAGAHTRVVHVERDGAVLVDLPAAPDGDDADDVLSGMTLAGVVSWCERVPLDDIAWVDEAERLTVALADEGLRGDYGLRVGKVVGRDAATRPVGTVPGQLPADVVEVVLARVAAASDARMGGADLPAMSNAGSGNQGITATMPVVVVADALGVTGERRTRALAMSHLVALHIHSRLPVLSGFCATLSAAMGAATGMAWLLDGSPEVIARAVNTMAGDAAGMVCDGAGCTCTLKVGTSVSVACRAVQLALAGIAVPGSNGLVHDDVDDTLRALGRFAATTRDSVDSTVLQIMMGKPAG